MGREVKRVHLDFDWFETQKEKDSEWSKTWTGFLLQDIKCFLCNGKGKNSKGKECPLCYGDGKVNPKVEPPKRYDKDYNGFQIWQDVSEGSPISPVFKKASDLAKWMVKNDTSTSRGTSYQAWLKMIKEEGSAPSGVFSSEGFKDGMSLFEGKEVDYEQEIIEKLAKLEHKQWCHWTKYFLSQDTKENRERWRIQMRTLYKDLSEEEKNSDRAWAKEVIKLLKDQKVGSKFFSSQP